MLIIAKAVKGKEFLYNARTAHQVSKASAQKICEIVNQFKYLLGSNNNEVWHVYEVNEYDKAFYYAQYQKFTIRKGIVTARHY